MATKFAPQFFEFNLSNPIGKGHNGTAYDLGDGTILKLSKVKTETKIVENEFHVAQLAHEVGLPTPKAIAFRHSGNQSGIVFSLFAGMSLAELVLTKPWRLFSATREAAKIFAQIHQVKVDGLRPVRHSLRKRIARVPELSEEERRITLCALDGLNDGERLCHFDFHPGNILTNGREYKVIDWGGALVGDPFADLAHAYILNKVDGTLTNVPWFNRTLIRSARSLYLHFFLYSYAANTADLSYKDVREGVKNWVLPIAASRLASYGDFETRSLLRIIHREIRRISE